MKRSVSPHALRNLKDKSKLVQRLEKLKSLLNKLDKTNNSKLKECFIRWWKVEQKVLRSKCEKLNMNNMKKMVLHKIPLDKYFRRWLKNMIVFPELNDQYKNNNRDVFERLKKWILDKNISYNKDFFGKLKETVAPAYLERVLFHKLLPRCKKLNQRINEDLLGNYFRKWRKITEKDEVKKLQFKFLHKLKSHKLVDLLRKKFIQWRNNKTIDFKVYPNTIKGTNKLVEVAQKNQGPEIFRRLKRMSEMKTKDAALKNIILEKSRRMNDRLRECFIQWWKTQLTHEKVVFRSQFKGMKLRNIKKIILLNKPLNKYFRRWIKNMIEIKAPQQLTTKEALSKLVNAIKRNVNKEVFPMIREYATSEYLINAFVRRVFPLCKNLNDRKKYSKLRYYFNRWRKKNELAKHKKMKLRILSNLKSYDENDNIRRAFNLWRYVNLQEKTKMYTKTVPGAIKGIEIFQRVLRKHIGPQVLDKLRVKYEEKTRTFSLINRVKHKLKSEKFELKEYFMKWKRYISEHKDHTYRALFDKMKGTYMKNLKKNIEKINSYNLEYYFWKWLQRIITSNQDKKSIDLFKLMNVVKKVYTISNGKVFLEKLKNYVSPHYLRKAVVKKLLPSMRMLSEKMNKGDLRKYFQFWKKANDTFHFKNAKFILMYKLRGRSLRDELRRKFNLWRKINSAIKKRVKANIPILVEQIKRSALRSCFDDFFKKPYTESKICNLRENIFNSVLKKNGKLQTHYLRKCFLKWKELMTDYLLTDFKSKLVKNHLKLYNRNHNSNKLRKAFYAWQRGEPYVGEDDKEREQKLEILRNRRKTLSSNMFNFIIGERILRHLYQRKALRLFNKRTHLRNLRVPTNVSLKQALLSSTKGISKNISIKLLFIRNYFNKWRKAVKEGEIEDLKTDVVMKLFSKCKFMSHLPLKHAFQKWRNRTNQLNMKTAETEFKANIYTLLYKKHSKEFLRDKFIFWRNEMANYRKKLESLVHGYWKLKLKLLRDNFNLLKKKGDYKRIFDVRKVKSLAVIKQVIKGTDKGTLLEYFYLWKNNLVKRRENQFKRFILKSMINKYENNNTLKDRNLLKEVFLKWKINSMPKDVLEKVSANRKGIELFKKTIRAAFGKEAFEKIREKLKGNKTLEKLKKQIELQAQKLNNHSLKNAFDHLNEMVIDRRNMQQKLKKMFEKYMLKKNSEIYSAPARNLINCIKDVNDLRNEKAIKIQRRFKSGKVKQRNKLLENTMENVNLRNILVYRIYLHRWSKNSKLAHADENASTIQDYIRKRMGIINHERSTNKLSQMFKKYVKQSIAEIISRCCTVDKDRCDKMFKVLEDIFIRRPFHKILNCSLNQKNAETKKAVISKMFKKKRNGHLAHYFNKFKENTIHDALRKTKKIQNLFKCNFIKKKQYILVKKEETSNKLVQKFEKLQETQLDSYFLRWKNYCRRYLIHSAATKIQNLYRNTRLYKHLQRNHDQYKLKELAKRFNKSLLIGSLRGLNHNNEKLYAELDSLMKDPKIEKVIATNNMIYIANNKVRNGLVQRAVLRNHEINRVYFIKKYFKRWRDMISHIKKGNLLLLKERFTYLISKHENDEKNKLGTYFTKWRRTVNSELVTESLDKISRFLKAGMEMANIQKWRRILHKC